MKVCLAQVRSETGAVAHNIDRHLAALARVRRGAADLVAFPELSLSNYDPDAAADAALTPADDRLGGFQRFADATGTAVAVGAPLQAVGKPHIAMFVFTAGRAPTVVGKRYLHADEISYFAPAEAPAGVLDLTARVGIAICYELSVAAHTAAVMAQAPALYLASVAKTADGVAAARTILSETARRYDVPVLMVNSVGTCEGKRAGGGSLALDRTGQLIGQLDDAAEGLLFVDTVSGTAWSASASAP